MNSFSLWLRYPSLRLVLAWLASLALFGVLSGCASAPEDAKAPEGNFGWSMHGTESVMKRDIEVINLLFLVDPELHGKSLYMQSKGSGRRDWSDLDLSEKYDYGFVAFETRYSHSDSDKARLRNMVQERIMMASERRCHHFLIEFRRKHAETNFGLGIATTFSAGIGALVPGVRASKNLSGVAGILSGMRGEFNDAFYANLATSVIIRGIDESRIEAREKLRVQSRQVIGNYSMAAAVNDAVVFDSLCTVAAGLDKANEALTKIADPGLETMNRALLKSNVTNLLAQRKYDELKTDLSRLDAAGVDTRWLVPRGRALAGTVGENEVGSSRFDESVVGDNPQTFVENQARRVKARLQAGIDDTKARLSSAMPVAMSGDEKKVGQEALKKLLLGQGMESTVLLTFTQTSGALTATTATETVTLGKLSSTQTFEMTMLNNLQTSCVALQTTTDAIAAYNTAQRKLNAGKLLGDSKEAEGAMHELRIADDSLKSLSRKFEAYSKAAEKILANWLTEINKLAERKDLQTKLNTWSGFAGLLKAANKLGPPAWNEELIPKSLQCK